MSANQCLDCTATEVDRTLTHDQSCPSGKALDVTSDNDREFFEQHPAAKFYWRGIQLSEVADLRRAGIFPNVPGEAVGKVLVTAIGPGLRTRSFANVVYVLDLGATQ